MTGQEFKNIPLADVFRAYINHAFSLLKGTTPDDTCVAFWDELEELPTSFFLNEFADEKELENFVSFLLDRYPNGALFCPCAERQISLELGYEHVWGFAFFYETSLPLSEALHVCEKHELVPNIVSEKGGKTTLVFFLASLCEYDTWKEAMKQFADMLSAWGLPPAFEDDLSVKANLRGREVEATFLDAPYFFISSNCKVIHTEPKMDATKILNPSYNPSELAEAKEEHPSEPQGTQQDSANEHAPFKVMVEPDYPHIPPFFARIHYSKNKQIELNDKTLMTYLIDVDKEYEHLIKASEIMRGVPIAICADIYELSNVTKYHLFWKTRTGVRKYSGLWEEVVKKMRADGLDLAAPQTVRAVMNRILMWFEDKGYVRTRTLIADEGIFLTDGSWTIVGWYVPNEINKDKLREALRFLNDLAKRWNPAKFSEVIKWAVVAPFSFELKRQRNEFIPWLYLFSKKANAGKSTLAIITRRIWGRDEELLSGESAAKETRLSYYVAKSGFPLVIEETANLFPSGRNKGKSGLVDMIKNCVTKIEARTILTTTREPIQILSIAPVCFTANHAPPNDDALVGKRLKVIDFEDPEDVKSKEERLEFKKTVLPVITDTDLLEYIGFAVVHIVTSEPRWWELIQNPEEILRRVYVLAGLEAPEWIGLRYEYVLEEEDPAASVLRAIKNVLFDLYRKGVGTYLEHKTVYQVAVAVAEKFDETVFLMHKKGQNCASVYITSSFLELVNEYLERPVSLTSIAKLFGLGEPKPVRHPRIKGRATGENRLFWALDITPVLGDFSEDVVLISESEV